jgi:quinol monooxygenase YgiN
MKLTNDGQIQTVIITYDVSLGTFDELLGILNGAYTAFITQQQGFVGAAIHVNDAKTRIASYSQWETREDFMGVLRSEHMQQVNKQLADLSKGFEPVLYEVNEMYSKP